MIDATVRQCRRAEHVARARGCLGSAHDPAMRPSMVAWIGACVLVLVGGCGPRGPAVEMVEGVVLLDGKPVEGATVFFSPVSSADEARAGLPAAGRTGPDGAFRLNAGGGAKPGAGTKVGDYIVTVIKQESDPLPPPDLEKPPAAPPEITVRDLLPDVYKLAATSPLRATVKKGDNVYRFDLDSTSRAGRP